MKNCTDLETSIVKRIRNTHGMSDRDKNAFPLKEYNLLEQCETLEDISEWESAMMRLPQKLLSISEKFRLMQLVRSRIPREWLELEDEQAVS